MKKRVWNIRGIAAAVAVMVLPSAGLAAGMIDLPRTGQEKCYDSAGKAIVCTGTGQDGAIRAGAIISRPRLVDNGNGTITDPVTGLIWVRNASCFYGNWQDSLDKAATLADGVCGLADGSAAGDWRLPNINELQSLLDFSLINPNDPTAMRPFVNVPDACRWSSTTATDGASAWYTSRFDTTAFSKVNGCSAWFVRGGGQ